MKLVVDPKARFTTAFSVSDGTKKRLEDCIDDLASRMLAKAAEGKAREEMYEEELKSRRDAEARRQARDARRAASMLRIEKAEKAFAVWRRAQDLRAWGMALECESTAQAASGNLERAHALGDEAAWVRRAADHLDPLVVGALPSVDGLGIADDEPT